MGRNKIDIDFVENKRKRKYCFKKRRFALVKKAIELSELTGCTVEVRVMCDEDNSLVTYSSTGVAEDSPKLDELILLSDQYVCFDKVQHGEMQSLDELLTNTGHIKAVEQAIIGKLSGFNQFQLLNMNGSKYNDDR